MPRIAFADADASTKLGIQLPPQSRQAEAQKLPERIGNGSSISLTAGRQQAEAGHQIKRLFIRLDRQDHRTTFLPRAPRLGVTHPLATTSGG
jgi:hypothetical protein